MTLETIQIILVQVRCSVGVNYLFENLFISCGSTYAQTIFVGFKLAERAMCT